MNRKRSTLLSGKEEAFEEWLKKLVTYANKHDFEDQINIHVCDDLPFDGNRQKRVRKYIKLTKTKKEVVK